MSNKKNGSGNNTPPPGPVSATAPQQYRVPTVELAEYEIEADVIALVPRALCEIHKVIPVARVVDSLVVALIDPKNVDALDGLKRVTGLAIEPVIATEAAIAIALQKYYASSD